MKISAYIPAYNNEKNIAQTIESILKQSIAVDELFVCDDGSTDSTVAVCQKYGITVYKNKENKGRGYSRRKAMEIAKNELVFCIDAGKSAAFDFLEQCMPLFHDHNIAAVVGNISQGVIRNSADRWKAIYLYKENRKDEQIREGDFITFGAIVRKSTILKIGNYNPNLTHSEDLDMGKRLTNLGFKVLFNPEAKVMTMHSESIATVLERYWRWYAGENEEVSLKQYLLNIYFSIKVMAWNDLKDFDILRAFISLICPHYQFWKNFR